MTNRIRSGYLAAFSRAYGWATERLYHELAWAYDPISRFVSGGRWDAWRGFALDYVRGPRVLELGFGTGELLLAMERRGLAVVGLDLSRPMHRVVSRKSARNGFCAPRLLGRAEGLPFASAVFETVVSTFPAGYILQAATFREVRRVLTPAGRLVIAGLIVRIPRSIRQPLSITPDAPADRLWSHIEDLAREAGLSCEVIWRQDGRALVPVVICEWVEESA
jgi:SAM-dependent methyltransferase